MEGNGAHALRASGYRHRGHEGEHGVQRVREGRKSDPVAMGVAGKLR